MKALKAQKKTRKNKSLDAGVAAAARVPNPELEAPAPGQPEEALVSPLPQPHPLGLAPGLCLSWVPPMEVPPVSTPEHHLHALIF